MCICVCPAIFIITIKRISSTWRAISLLNIVPLESTVSLQAHTSLSPLLYFFICASFFICRHGPSLSVGVGLHASLCICERWRRLTLLYSLQKKKENTCTNIIRYWKTSQWSWEWGWKKERLERERGSSRDRQMTERKKKKKKSEYFSENKLPGSVAWLALSHPLNSPPRMREAGGGESGADWERRGEQETRSAPGQQGKKKDKLVLLWEKKLGQTQNEHKHDIQSFGTHMNK